MPIHVEIPDHPRNSSVEEISRPKKQSIWTQPQRDLLVECLQEYKAASEDLRPLVLIRIIHAFMQEFRPNIEGEERNVLEINIKQWLDRKAPLHAKRILSPRKSRWNHQEQSVLMRYIERFRTEGETARKVLLATQVMPDFIRTCRSEDITSEGKQRLKQTIVDWLSIEANHRNERLRHPEKGLRRQASGSGICTTPEVELPSDDEYRARKKRKVDSVVHAFKAPQQPASRHDHANKSSGHTDSSITPASPSAAAQYMTLLRKRLNTDLSIPMTPKSVSTTTNSPSSRNPNSSLTRLTSLSPSASPMSVAHVRTSARPLLTNTVEWPSPAIIPTPTSIVLNVVQEPKALQDSPPRKLTQPPSNFNPSPTTHVLGAPRTVTKAVSVPAFTSSVVASSFSAIGIVPTQARAVTSAVHQVSAIPTSSSTNLPGSTDKNTSTKPTEIVTSSTPAAPVYPLAEDIIPAAHFVPTVVQVQDPVHQLKTVSPSHSKPLAPTSQLREQSSSQQQQAPKQQKEATSQTGQSMLLFQDLYNAIQAQTQKMTEQSQQLAAILERINHVSKQQDDMAKNYIALEQKVEKGLESGISAANQERSHFAQIMTPFARRIKDLSRDMTEIKEILGVDDLDKDADPAERSGPRWKGWSRWNRREHSEPIDVDGPGVSTVAATTGSDKESSSVVNSRIPQKQKQKNIYSLIETIQMDVAEWTERLRDPGAAISDEIVVEEVEDEIQEDLPDTQMDIVHIEEVEMRLQEDILMSFPDASQHPG